ncbi:asparagine synthetase B family protein [Rivularia sp. UHCC 0363]|uniref:asparagine synthetase B family protein n=1 Tax=Rivularia sp. UHCC 0363 TaxID=3110244 RepID=UPI002B1EA266|nr:asparagine synthase-related protein [Rivularia sp. UHCC 0363]MEA5598620.1 asparagine synthase-related protein [Rivularia sp. UHCC 0363]
MKFPSLRNKTQIPDIRAVPNWFVILGRLDASNYDVTYSCEEFFVVNAEAVKSKNGRFIIVGDVWLSNRSQLLQNLHSNKEYTDQELVAHLWEIKGKECLNLLEGMFSLCVWDNSQREVYLARDGVGCRTIYYSSYGKSCAIAPRLATLLPFHTRQLDLVALRDYLCCAFVPGEQTLWQNVRELSVGMVLQMESSGETINYVSQKLFWEPREDIQNAEESLIWHGKQLRTLLDRVVQESLPVDAVGVYLSGGLDSSCMTALAAKFHNHPVHTYSIHFGENCPSELEFSGLVAQHCKTQHHILEITASDMWDKLPLTMSYLDDPIGDPLTVPNYLLGKIARQDIYTVLNGEGGDPCFGGPKNQPMLLERLYGGVNHTEKNLVTNYVNSFKKCSSDLPQLLKPEIFAAVKDKPFVFANYLHGEESYLNRLMTINIKFKGADHILTKVNNLTVANELEGRSPLFDRRIVEMAMQIPPQYKLAGAQEKAVLKQAVLDVLPREIIERPKSGMMVPVQYWFRHLWQRRAKSLLLNRNAEIAPYLNQDLIKQWLNYRGDAWQRYGVKLWLLVSLEIWLQVQKGR